MGAPGEVRTAGVEIIDLDAEVAGRDAWQADAELAGALRGGEVW